MNSKNYGKTYSQGFPCHKYIVRNLDSEIELLEFEKSFITTMSDNGYGANDIDLALTLLQSKPSPDSKIFGKDFHMHGKGSGLVQDNFISSIVNDSSIPTSKSCSSYYRKYDRTLHACSLCPLNEKRYVNKNKDIEYALVHYCLSSKENYDKAISLGLSSSDFKCLVDVSGDFNVKRSYPFKLANTVISALKTESIRTQQFCLSDEFCDPIKNAIKAKLRKMKLPIPLSEKRQQDGLINSWGKALYMVELPDDSTAERYISILKEASSKPMSCGVSNGPVQLSLFEEILFNDMPVNNTAPVTTSSVAPDTSNETINKIEASSKNSINNIEDTPVLDDLHNKEEIDEDLVLPNDSSSDNTNTKENGSEKTGDGEFYYSCESEVANDPIKNNVMEDDGLINGEIVLANENNISDYTIDAHGKDVTNDPFSTLVRLGEQEDYIYIPSISMSTLDLLSAINLDDRNAVNISRLESMIMHTRKMIVEVCIVSTQMTLVVWLPDTQTYFYSSLLENMSFESLSDLLSASSIEKITYNPYLLYCMCNKRGCKLKNVVSLQSLDFVSNKLDRDYVSTFRDNGVLNEFLGLEVLRANNSDEPVFYLMPSYSSLERKLRLSLNSSEVEAFEQITKINEAIGYSYLNPYAGKSIYISMPHSMSFHFNLKNFERAYFGYILMYQFGGDDGDNISKTLLCELVEKGRFRKCKMQLIGMDKSTLFLYISQDESEYIISYIDSLLSDIKFNYNFQSFTANVAYKLVGSRANL